MIEIDFGETGGGQKGFRDIEELRNYVESQISEWNEDETFKELQPAQKQKLTPLWQGWGALRNQINQAEQQHSEDETRFRNQIQNQAGAQHLFRAKSVEARHVREVFDELGLPAANGAVTFLIEPDNQQNLLNMPKRELKGALAYWARSNGLSSKAAAAHRDAVRDLVNEMQERSNEHLGHLEEVEQEHDESLNSFKAELRNQQEGFAEYRSEVAAEIETDRTKWQQEWDDKLNLYTEQLKLKAAVKQWTDRADGHADSFKAQRLWTIIIGVVGIILAVLISWGALRLGHWLFSDALVAGEASPPPGQLRPTWFQELIFAASVSILYLTMFLWGMRILVRMMMTEHHLAIDARSRASMAHTYLALIEQGAVDENDRAIVLASLFRPVTDGIVKDDGLPAVSPATLLSAQLAGQNR